MSIVIALVSSKNCVVASDGRVMNENRILSNKRDKTFVLDKGEIIGCYAGLMSFCGMEIHVRLNNYFQNYPKRYSIKERVDLSVTELYQKLCRCSLSNRNVDITIAIKQHNEVSLNGYRILLDTDYVNDFEVLSPIHLPINSNKYAWQIWGNNSAYPAILNLINKPTSGLPSKNQLAIMADKAINIGISNCKPDSNNIKDCGGTVFVQKDNW